MRRLLVPLALLPLGCRTSDPAPPTPSPTVLTGLRGAPIDLQRSPELDEIALLEVRRSLGGGQLLQYLQDADPRTRVRAARALGRLPLEDFGAPVTEALCRALDDPSPGVRTEVAFALGQRADPDTAGVLAAYRNSPDRKVRAALVAAASKIDDAGLREHVRLSLRDADLGVRIEAAVGTARWDPEAPDADEIDRALLDALRPYRIGPQKGTKTAVEAELVWRILFALARRKAELGRAAFLEYVDGGSPLERLFALRGLAQLPSDPDTTAAVVQALSKAGDGTDWRSIYEGTVALERFADPDTIPVLEELLEHESAHVRAGALSALGAMKGHRDEVLKLLQRGRLDLSATVRAAAVLARIHILEPDEAVQVLERHASDEDPVVRLAVAEAARDLDDPRSVGVLERLVRDPSLQVAVRATESLGGHLGPKVRVLLHELLAQEDNGLRLAAAQALGTEPTEEDIGPLLASASSAQGDIATELAFTVLEIVGPQGGEEVRAHLEASLRHPNGHVREVARRGLRQSFGLVRPEMPPTVAPVTDLPLPGRDYPRWASNPLVEIQTNRGSMVFELFAAEAPQHVFNFLQIAERGEYDDLTFHRVVPDFVVQGGCYRGDGNGARPARGEGLPHEFGSRKYGRGSLGMPRNADPDSGGSQFFITHRPTPHLDGSYTLFGELRTGGEVLDALELGDRILRVIALP